MIFVDKETGEIILLGMKNVIADQLVPIVPGKSILAIPGEIEVIVDKDSRLTNIPFDLNLLPERTEFIGFL